MRVVHPEDPDAVLDPLQRDAQALGVEPGRVAVEVQRVDVLVALRRVLRVGDRAVGPDGEPLRMRGDPRVVGRALQREVERDLHAELIRARDERVEVVEVAELRVDRVVPARGRADRPRGADVARLGVHGVVAALAVHGADRVDRREVDDVEAHLRDAVELLGRGDERAVHRAAGLVAPAGGPREDLVPGAEQRPRAVGEDVALRALGDQLPDRALGHDRDDGREQRRGDPRPQRERRVAQRVRGADQQVALRLLGRAAADALEQAGPGLQVVGQLVRGLTGLELLLDGVAPRRPRVAPGVHAEAPPARRRRHDERREPVGPDAVGLHPDELGLTRGAVLADRGPYDVGRDGVVPLAPHRGADRDDLADHGLARIPGLHERGHVVDSEPSRHRPHSRGIALLSHVPVNRTDPPPLRRSGRGSACRDVPARQRYSRAP